MAVWFQFMSFPLSVPPSLTSYIQNGVNTVFWDPELTITFFETYSIAFFRLFGCLKKIQIFAQIGINDTFMAVKMQKQKNISKYVQYIFCVFM